MSHVDTVLVRHGHVQQVWRAHSRNEVPHHPDGLLIETLRGQVQPGMLYTGAGFAPLVLPSRATAEAVQAEARRRIEDRYPAWKQLNLIGEAGAEFRRMRAFIEVMRAASNRLETLPVIPEDYAADRHWRTRDDVVDGGSLDPPVHVGSSAPALAPMSVVHTPAPAQLAGPVTQTVQITLAPASTPGARLEALERAVSAPGIPAISVLPVSPATYTRTYAAPQPPISDSRNTLAADAEPGHRDHGDNAQFTSPPPNYAPMAETDRDKAHSQRMAASQAGEKINIAPATLPDAIAGGFDEFDKSVRELAVTLWSAEDEVLAENALRADTGHPQAMRALETVAHAAGQDPIVYARALIDRRVAAHACIIEMRAAADIAKQRLGAAQSPEQAAEVIAIVGAGLKRIAGAG